MLELLISSLLATLGIKGVPAGVVAMIIRLMPEVVEVVRGLLKKRNKGEEKRQAAIEGLKEFIDNELDDLPEWKELTEEQRDRILEGWIETAYFLISLDEKRGRRGGKRALSRALKRLQKETA